MENSPGQTLVNPDPKVNSKVKLHCSYGGTLKHRNGELCYDSSDHKTVTVERDIKFADLYEKLSSVFNTTEAFAVKYQLPFCDLHTLIHVEEDEDVENMMEEYELIMEDKGIRVRMFLFPPKIEPEKSFYSIDSFSGSEFVFGSDEEAGSDSGPSLDPVVENEDQSVVEPKCGSSVQAGMIVTGLSSSSPGSDDSVNDTDVGTIGKNVASEIPRKGHVNGGVCVPVAGKVVSSRHTSYGSSVGSNSVDNRKNVELQLVPCEGQVNGGACVSVRVSGGKTGSGSSDSVNDTDNGAIGKNVKSEIPREGHVSGGHCVSVAGKAVNSGRTSSGSSAGSNSDDNGENVELQKVPCEDHVSGGACVSVPASGGKTGSASASGI